MSVKSQELTALIEEYQKVECRSLFDASATKNTIRQKLNGEPPKIALLDNPEAVKAIDAKLEEWSKEATKP